MCAIPSDVTVKQVREELSEAEDYLAQTGLQVDLYLDDEPPRFQVSGEAHKDGEQYIAEFECGGYPEQPPLVEMVDPETGEIGTKRAYPDCFHQEPCICARFNRKAYSTVHEEWDLSGWDREANNTHLGDMIAHVFGAINEHLPNHNRGYSGRQE